MGGYPLLTLCEVTKCFPGVRALHNVSFAVEHGEVHALVGENGAGKSTLMKIVTGVYQADSGSTLWDGTPVQIDNPRRAADLGIATIFQELSVVPDMTVAENIFLGRLPVARVRGVVNKRALFREAQEVLGFLKSEINVNSLVRELSIAQRQMVEIARAVSRRARLILMDEPTSSLSTKEIQILFETVQTLKGRGVSIVYVSHRLEEVFEIADRITVLRDGCCVGTLTTSQATVDVIVRMMVGRSVDDLYPVRNPIVEKPVIMEIEHLTRKGCLEDVNFQLHEGEVLCVCGLVGAGKSELARALFGLDKGEAGHIRIQDKVFTRYSPATAKHLGLGLIPEERQKQALFPEMSVSHNIGVAILKRLCKRWVINKRQEASIAKHHVDALDIKTPSVERPVKFLSGGNQQKVVLARWLETAPRILILDEPTRGIDVGAKAEVHRLIRELADKGMGIILFSSELPEVIGMCDRVLVMSEGRSVALFGRDEVTPEGLLRVMIGGKA